MHVALVLRRDLLFGSGALALAALLPEPLFAEPDTSGLEKITGDAVAAHFTKSRVLAPIISFPAFHTAPATASAWMGTSRSTLSATRQRR